MRTTPAGHAAAEATLFALRDDLVAAVDNDDRSRAEIAYAAGVTEEELDGLLTQDRIDFTQAMTVAAGLTTGAQIAFLTEYAPNGGTPTVTGTPTQGQLLTAVPGAYTGSPTPTLAYVWKRCDEDGVEVEDIAAPGVAVVATTVGGVAGVDEQQTVTLGGSPDGGTFTLTHGVNTTAGIAFNAANSAVKSAMVSAGIGASGDLTVAGSNGGPYTVTFTGDFAGTNVAQMTASAAGLTKTGSGTAVVATTVPGAAEPATDEQQTITVTATGGTFTVTYSGQTTGALAHDISAADLKIALEGLSNIDPDDLTVTLNAGVYTVTFGGTLAATDVAQMTTTVTSLVGSAGTVTVATSVPGVVPVKEVQVVTFYAGEGSTFTLTAEGQSATSAIDLDVATADDVEARLDVAGVEGDIQVTGAVGGPFTLTYGNVTAPGNRSAVAVDQSDLTAGSKYLLVADDVDGTIRVEVTATNSQGEEVNLSEPTDVIVGL